MSESVSWPQRSGAAAAKPAKDLHRATRAGSLAQNALGSEVTGGGGDLTATGAAAGSASIDISLVGAGGLALPPQPIAQLHTTTIPTGATTFIARERITQRARSARSVS